MSLRWKPPLMRCSAVTSTSDEDFTADPATLRAVATLCRARSAIPRTVDRRDAVERLGADRALVQLAKDLEATACYLEGSGRASKVR